MIALQNQCPDIVLIAAYVRCTRGNDDDELRHARPIHLALKSAWKPPQRQARRRQGVGRRIILVDDRPSSTSGWRRSFPPSIRRCRGQSGGGAVTPRRQIRLLIVSLSLGKTLRLAAAESGARAGAQPPGAIWRSRCETMPGCTRARDRSQDYLLRPAKERIAARARTQLAARYTDHLRAHVQNSIEMAITDALRPA